MKFFATFAAVVLVIAALPVSARSGATISHADGTGFILVSGSDRTEFDIASDDVVGLPLKVGDTIRTDEGSFLEITLGEGIIKLAGNTTFTVTALDENNSGVFNVAYGRIRVKVAGLLAGSRLWITGHDTVAGVRGTDFGYDVFFDRSDRDMELQTAVYCFDGEVDVLQYDKETVSKIDLLARAPFVLGAGKMVKTVPSAPTTKLLATDIDGKIIEYWDANPIRTGVEDIPKIDVSEVLEEPKIDLLEVPEEPEIDLLEVPEEPEIDLLEVSEEPEIDVSEVSEEPEIDVLEVSEEPEIDVSEVPEEPEIDVSEIPEEPEIDVSEVPEDQEFDLFKISEDPEFDLSEIPEDPKIDLSEVSDDLDLSVDPNFSPQNYGLGGKLTFVAGVGMMTAAGLLRAFLPDNSSAADISLGLLTVGGPTTVIGGGLMIYSCTLK